MKKISLIAFPLLVLTSCGRSNIPSLSIIAPQGAPSLAFYKYGNLENFETNGDSNNIVAMMAAGQKDIVVLPTNVGISAITKKNVDYKISTIITNGNLFIASTGNDDDGVMDENDYIVSFQQGSLPDKMFHFIYGEKFDANLHYVQNAQAAAGCLKSGVNIYSDNEKVDYVLLAQPALQNVINSTPGRFVYKDLQKDYKEKTGYEMLQASIFIKNGIDKQPIDSFLASLNNDIVTALENPNAIKESLKNVQAQSIYGVTAEIAEQVTENGNGMGLCFINAYKNKSSVDNFLQIFEIGETDEKIYYK